MAPVQPLHLYHTANSATLNDEILMITIANRSKHTANPPHKLERNLTAKNQHFPEENVIYI